MANPQCENGYTKIANDIMDALARIRIPGEVSQIIRVILRKTYGFNKKEDIISLSQFVLATGLCKPSCVRAINKAVSMNLINKNANGIGTSYRFNKDFESWNPLTKKLIVNKNANDHLQKSKCSVNKKATYKRNNTTKETITKENKNTIVRDFIAKYCESFKALYGIRPHISGKDAGIGKRLVAIPNIEVIMERFFQSKDKFIINNRHSLGILESQINKLMVGEIDKYSGIKEWLEEKEKKEIAKE